MTSGVGEFSISAVKDIGKESTAKELLATGEGVQNFFVVLPGSGNETVAIPFHNGYPDALRDHLKLSAVFRSEGAPLPGWEAGDLEWKLSGKHLLHPDRFLADQPLSSQLEETVNLLDQCIAGRLEQPAYLSRLNRIGLPANWRNHLATEIYRHAPHDSDRHNKRSLGASPVVTPSSPDPLDALLASVEMSGPSEMPQSRPAAASDFIQEVGSDHSGFILDKESAKAMRVAFDAFLKRLMAQVNQAGLPQLLGMGAGIAAVMKQIRFRQKQQGWIISAGTPAEAIADFLTELPGKVQVAVVIGANSWEAAFTPATRQLANQVAAVLIQIPEDKTALAEFLAGAQLEKTASKIFLMSGEVRQAFGESLCAMKPAALAWLEGCLAQKRLPAESLADFLVLDDQDPCPGQSERHVAGRLLPDSEWVSRVSQGNNVLNGELGTVKVIFRPLVAASEIRAAK